MRFLLALCFLVGFFGAAEAQTAPYRLHVGDSISISVWQDSKLDRQVIVAPDGTISFPLVGHIRVSGLTLPAVEGAIRDGLQSNYKTPLDVTATLTTAVKVATPGGPPPANFFITGEIAKPGAYPLGRPPVNAVQAIALSGGFSPFAATGRILINRTINGQQLQFVFNYRDFESGRDLSGNIDLRAGDVVVVPEKGLFGH